MIKLIVWLTFHNGQTVRVGELVTGNPDSQGKLHGQFRYDRFYLEHPYAFPLDPFALPLGTSYYNTERPYAGVHGVFEDSLPDDWGRQLLAKRYKLARGNQRVPNYLAVLGADGLGALSYGLDEAEPPETEPVNIRHLTELQRLTDQFERNAAIDDDDWTLLFQAGSSPGGARPKVLVEDHNHSYIAKLPSINDTFDIVALESATMQLARLAGLSVAPSHIVESAAGKILLVERFDIAEQQRGRHHMISMQTLLKAEGFYNLGYREMAEVIRKISDSPSRDLHNLFKQLVFNVVIGNTDDHLKNFLMLFDGEQWILSPAYDLVPNVSMNREHVLRIGLSNIVPNRQALIDEAKYFNADNQQQSNDLIDSVVSSASRWKEEFLNHGVPQKDIAILGKDIEQRIERISM